MIAALRGERLEAIMADYPKFKNKAPESRHGSEPRFGRNAVDRPKPRGNAFRMIAALVLVAAVAITMATYGPEPHGNRSTLWSWFAEWREAQRQVKLDESVQRPGQARKEVEAVRQEAKDRIDAARTKFVKEIEALKQKAAPESQAEERQAAVPAEEQQAAVRTDEGKSAPAQKQSLAAHDDAVVWLSVSPDGTRLLSASTDKSIKLWDAESGLLVREVGRQSDMVRSALFLPGGGVLSGADDGLIDIWSVADGKLEATLDASEFGGVRGLALSGDGSVIVSSHQSGAIVQWNVKERRKLHVLTGHQWPANAVAVSPDGTRALSGDIDGVIRTWDVKAGKPLRLWKGHETGVYGAAFLPDGRQAVTSGRDGVVRLWDVADGRNVRSFPGHAGNVYALAISADGRRMLSGSLDGTARLRDIATGKELAYFDNEGKRIYSVALTGDGKLAIGDDTGTIRILAEDGAMLRTLAAGPAQ